MITHAVLQCIEQPAAVVVHRPDRRELEQLRKSLLHELSVLQHVRHARRAAQIVLQHVVLAIAVAYQIGARDVAPNPARRGEPHALGTKTSRGRRHMLRQDAFAHHPTVMIQIVNQHVERGNSLPQPALQCSPLVAADDARYDVEGNNTLVPLRIAVHVERNAELHHGPVGRPLAADQVVRRNIADTLEERLAIRPRRAEGIEHFVKKAVGLIAGESRTAAHRLRRTLHGAHRLAPSSEGCHRLIHSHELLRRPKFGAWEKPNLAEIANGAPAHMSIT